VCRVAHLLTVSILLFVSVIVKGTEYFDGKSSRYVDYPLTDVLQMIGRAGRPGFDIDAEAVVMCKEEMKPFYHKVTPIYCLERIRISVKSLKQSVLSVSPQFISSRVMSPGKNLRKYEC